MNPIIGIKLLLTRRDYIFKKLINEKVSTVVAHSVLHSESALPIISVRL